MVDCAFCQFLAGLETERLDDDSVLRNHTIIAPAVLTFDGWSDCGRLSLHARRYDAGCDCVFD